ncbi:MAG TPA: PPC domain-containing protein [Terriglobales bacterium]|nr:PPC domain-containing protein [Terriglobales bacterium]
MFFVGKKAAVFSILAAALILAGLALPRILRAPGELSDEALPDGGYALNLSGWSGSDTRQVELKKGEAVAVEVALDAGAIDLVLRGADGSVPYTGGDLESCSFQVFAPADGVYEVAVTGKAATGAAVFRPVH